MARGICSISLALILFQSVQPSFFLPPVQAASVGKSPPTDSAFQTPPSPPAGAGSKDDLELHSANGLQNSVKITSLPPVALQEKRKTAKDYLFEWGPWIFNLLLVIVGALQVRLLRQTLQQMARQSAYDRERDRAKLVVLFPPDRPDFIVHDAVGGVALNDLVVRIKNYGLTDAFNVEVKGIVLFGQDRSESTTQKLLAKFDRIGALTASDTAQITDSIPVDFACGLTTTITSEAYDKLLDGLTNLRLVGSIIYVDTYDDRHESPINFLWTFKHPTEKGVRVDRSEWTNQSGTAT